MTIALLVSPGHARRESIESQAALVLRPNIEEMMKQVNPTYCKPGFTCQPMPKVCGDGSEGCDPMAALEESLNDAKDTQPRLIEFLQAELGVLKAMGIEDVVLQGSPEGVKSLPSAMRKVAYAKFLRGVVDLSRASLIFSSESDIRVAEELLYETGLRESTPFQVVRRNDRFKNPMPIGHRDFQLNLMDRKNQHLVEVELHQCHVKYYHDHFGHRLYEDFRELMKSRPVGELNEQETKVRTEIISKMEPHYIEANEMSGECPPPVGGADAPEYTPYCDVQKSEDWLELVPPRPFECE